MPMVKVNDINMHYEVQGEGDPILLIAGLGTDLASYREIIRLLSKDHRVLAFDNRGEGLTDKPNIPYSMELMAEDTAGLLKALEISRANVIRISMGGRIAMQLALQHPELVKSLILTSTFARRTRNARLPLRFRVRKFASSRRRSSKPTQPYYAFARQLKAARSYDCSDKLDRISVPTLVLHGKKDNAVPYELGQELHAGIKGSKMISFDGGHRFSFWESERYAKAILEFLGQIDDKVQSQTFGHDLD